MQCKKHACWSLLEPARGLPKPHPCKTNSDAKNNVMPKKNCNAKTTPVGRSWNPPGVSPNHTAVKKLQCRNELQRKKDCLLEKCQAKIIDWSLVQVFFRFGASPHPNLPQNPFPTKLKRSKQRTKKAATKTNATQKELQRKINCYANKKATQK